MKKFLLLLAAAFVAAGAVQAKTADELRVYLNPGHGSYGPNDRPMSTINHPGTSNLADPDSMGFYEGRGTLPRSFALGQYLEKMGVKHENVVYSRMANGPWPYNADDPDKEKYNRPLSEICEEVEAGNFDIFISSHSNASTDGTNTNYPLTIYRGYDKGSQGKEWDDANGHHDNRGAGYVGNAVEGSYDMAAASWPTHWMSELDPMTNYGKNSPNIRGDIDFYGSWSGRTSAASGNRYNGYLGVLKHGTPGYLLEGFFHTYQPARHRALNFDYDRQEGRREARGIGAYFGLTPPTTGDIMGFVKDMHEKIVNTWYKYNAGTDDQWLPINGAQVKLMQGDAEVASYTVDGEYNGIFVFEDLQPGSYNIVATAEGYKAQFDVCTVTVTANESSYAKIFLESESYVPPAEVYENYPDPDQPSYLKLADKFNFNQTPTSYEMTGTVKATAQFGDSTVILTNEGITPHLYLVNSTTQTLIKELSTEGIYTENSPGFFSALNSITRSADRKLVGVSLTENQYADGQVGSGYTRGTARVYVWDDFDSAPRLFASTQNSGNYYNANVGHAISVNGAISKECEIVLPAMTTGSSLQIRLVHILMDGGEQISVFFDKTHDALVPKITGLQDAYGEELTMAVSPNGDDKLIIGGLGKIVEFTEATSSAGVPTDVVAISDEYGLTGFGFQCFKYAGHSMMIAPYAVDGVVKGVKLFDITGGLDNAKLIETTNTDIAGAPEGSPLKASHDPVLNGLTQTSATAVVDGTDIETSLVNGNNAYRITTKDAAQDAVKGILATGLNSNGNENTDWTFKFDANSDAKDAYLTFYDLNSGEEVGTVPLTGVKEGANEFTIPSADLPGENGQRMNWAVTLEGQAIPTFSLMNNLADFPYTYTFNTVDNNPESDYFGRIYIGHRPGNTSPNNGLWIYNPDYSRVNSTVIKTRNDNLSFRSNYRLGIDPEGKVYMPDWGDPTSGVFVFDPADEASGFKQFFANEDGSPLSRDGDGMLTNDNGEAVAGSATHVTFSGTGADTKMYVYNEDIIVNGKGNNVSVYSIGNADGSLAKTYNKVPDVTYAIGALEANGNGNMYPDPEHGGVWVSQYRSKGNNGAGVPSLIYVNEAGSVVYRSDSDVDFAANYMTGSMGAGFTMTPDGEQIVLSDGDSNISFYDIEWNGDAPTLVFKHKFTPASGVATTGGMIYQMNFDYAGNLIISGASVGIYAVPTEENITTVPAKKNLWVRKGYTTGIEDNTIANDVKVVASPNPTDGMVTISGVEVMKVEVFNAGGSLVVRGNDANVDLSNLAPGVYFVKVNGDKVVRVIKK